MKCLKYKNKGIVIRVSDSFAFKLLSKFEGIHFVPKSTYKRFKSKEIKENTVYKYFKKIKNKRNRMSKEIQKLQARILKLQAQNEELLNENEKLKKEQEEFQEALIAKVQEIESTPKAWRWLKYGKLLWDLIETIKKTIDKVRASK